MKIIINPHNRNPFNFIINGGFASQPAPASELSSCCFDFLYVITAIAKQAIAIIG
jgi:hypothetical protein